jgi:hypothetical protein
MLALTNFDELLFAGWPRRGLWLLRRRQLSGTIVSAGQTNTSGRNGLVQAPMRGAPNDA